MGKPDTPPVAHYVPKLWSADELAGHTFQYTYLAQPVIPAGGIVFFHGKRAIGKTHFALTLSACLEAGGRLFGRYQTKKTNVVYVQADMPHQIQQQRVVMAKTLYPLANTHFYFPTTLDILQLTRHHPLVDAVNTHTPGLVIWDTLRKVMRGSTNEDEVPSVVYGTVRELFPEATHLFIHHDKKTIVDQDALDREEWFRGSGAWLDDADTGIHLTEAAPGRLVLHFTKLRTCGEQDAIGLSINPEVLMLYANGPAQRLAADYRHTHTRAADADVYRHLLDMFVCSPRLAAEVAFNGGSNGTSQ